MQAKWQEQPTEESNAYSLFLYAVRSPVTRDYYLRRLRTFFNHIDLLPHGSMEQRCNLFAANGLRNPKLGIPLYNKILAVSKREG
jgi:hypothetical protein